MELKRKSGILLPITALPSPFGVGDMGKEAYGFVDFLHGAEQGLWQILPLGPTDVQFAGSPYSSISAFAMNPLLISPELLHASGLLSESDLVLDHGSAVKGIDYTAVEGTKARMLKKAYEKFNLHGEETGEFDDFCSAHQHWIDDYALFKSLRQDMQGKPWRLWPVQLRDRHRGELLRAQDSLHESIRYEKFLQYLCFSQWTALRAYASRRGIAIIGDIPLYVNLESADVWASPQLFKLDGEKNPLSVSGVPPDYFSDTGQLWNNPIFDWVRLEEEGFSWWVKRIAHNLSLYDCIRIDHFRGLAGFWEVPFGSDTAASGSWTTGPGDAFFEVMQNHFPALPFIAEDLGVITEDVKDLRNRYGLPGMRVLQFGFGEGASEFHRPHRYIENCVAYTGTHDNDTLIGWLSKPTERGGFRRKGMKRICRQIKSYLHLPMAGKKRLRHEILRSIFHSKAAWVVIPMQDILGLGTEARINRPGTTAGNWKWRLAPGYANSRARDELKSLTALSGRRGV